MCEILLFLFIVWYHISHNSYYLFVRDRNSDDLVLIPLSEYEIYGKGSMFNTIGKSLKDIDFFTTNFSSSTKLVEYLRKKKGIKFINGDIFIGSIVDDQVMFHEVIYSDVSEVILKPSSGCSKKEEAKYISKISNSYKSAVEHLRCYDNNSCESILRIFTYRMYHNQAFYEYVMKYENNLPSRFLDYYKCGFFNNDSSPIKDRDGGWCRDTYFLHRSIVEVIGRYEKHKRNQKYEIPSLNESDICQRVQFNNLLKKYMNDLETANDMNLDFFEKLKLDHFTIENNSIKIVGLQFSDDDMDKVNFLDEKVMRYLYLIAFYKELITEDDSDCYNEFNSVVKDFINFLNVNSKALSCLYDFMELYNKYIDSDNSNQYKKNSN